MTELTLPIGFDVTDPVMHGRGLPFEAYAELRRCAPVWWNEKPSGVGGFPDTGFWVVSRHAEVRDVSKRSEVFSSNAQGAIPRHEDAITPEELELTKFVLINKDAPEHTQLRRLVSKVFTPRGVEAMRAQLREKATRIVAEAAESGSGDFVTQVASELPIHAISELLGVPEDARKQIFDWSNQMSGYDDAETAGQARMANAQMLGYAYELAEQRRKQPVDDIISTLVHADVNGELLTPEEFGFFFIMLAVAGNETTRNATTLGTLAFMENPDQWQLFRTERPASAADEIIRYTTPLICQQRTALVNTMIGDTAIEQGQRVVMLYGSANFDDEVFDRPHAFDITRNPNPHLSFGGTGAHYCLGANLARLEVGLIFDAIADGIPDITRLSEPTRLQSGWLNGVKHLEVDYGVSSDAGRCPVAH
ncbi:cytochrome P450 [Aldersonia sp. NBC_00410]|uniref:cytochrome P450 n=1 Tax=Aldersonia sp. NBC_00410 TaxID=2975954 RepID=UPI0022503A90|nr:cytochrome P450 [Aldersonia sp. NBC_00410]MCX5043289.1 cytochrome P450 [Aldersonia sp. NBC_00410]